MAFEKKTVISCEYYELEELVKSHYGIDWNFVEDTESSNDTSHEFTVSATELDAWHAQDLQAFRDGKKNCYLAQTIMNDLCIAGKLEPGDYVVRVCW